MAENSEPLECDEPPWWEVIPDGAWFDGPTYTDPDVDDDEFPEPAGATA